MTSKANETLSSLITRGTSEETRKELQHLEHEIEAKLNSFTSLSERIEKWTDERSYVDGNEIKLQEIEELEKLLDRVWIPWASLANIFSLVGHPK